MKEKYLWFGIIIAFISWISNYTYYQSQQLDKPIFLDHYYESYISDQEQPTTLTFYYLTNKQYNANVMHVKIDGIDVYPVSDGGFSMWNTNNGPRYIQDFRHHYLKEVTVEIPKHSLEIYKTSNKTWSFDTMTVSFSNGDEVVADIGKVSIYPSLSNLEVLETRLSGSGSNHRSDKSLVATQNITVEEISSPFPELISDDIAMKVRLDQEKLKQLGKLMQGGNAPDWYTESRQKKWRELPGIPLQDDLFPITLKKGEWMQLSMQFNPERSSYFRFSIKIKGETESGKSYVRNAPIIDEPSLDQNAVNKIISVKQGGHSSEK